MLKSLNINIGKVQENEAPPVTGGVVGDRPYGRTNRPPRQQ